MSYFKTLVSVLILCLLGSVASAQDKPNIVLVFMDNFGWGEPGFNGGGIIRGAATPQLDTLASEGLRLTNFNVARYLGDTGLEAMQKRGRVQEGMVADITVLDPATVRDNATYARGTLPTTGIPFVIVNGTVVVRDSVVLRDINSGQPIRFPVEDAPRFQSVSVAEWDGEFLTAPTGFGGLDILD